MIKKKNSFIGLASVVPHNSGEVHPAESHKYDKEV